MKSGIILLLVLIVASQISLASTSSEDSIRLCYDKSYIRNQISCVANELKGDDDYITSSNIYNYIKYNWRSFVHDTEVKGVNDIWTTMTGDCKEQSILYQYMLDVVGIENRRIGAFILNRIGLVGHSYIEVNINDEWQHMYQGFGMIPKVIFKTDNFYDVIDYPKVNVTEYNRREYSDRYCTQYIYNGKITGAETVLCEDKE